MARELADEIKRGGGLITAEDLAEYEVKERQPIKGTYRGYEVISAPPPSSGGITLMETLNIWKATIWARWAIALPIHARDG